MTTAGELKKWLEAINDETTVFIDEGGLAICTETGSYYEVGGEPLPEEKNDEIPAQG